MYDILIYHTFLKLFQRFEVNGKIACDKGVSVSGRPLVSKTNDGSSILPTPAHAELRSDFGKDRIRELSENTELKPILKTGFSCRLSKKKFDPAFLT